MIVAGFGFRKGASLESLLDALSRANVTDRPVFCIATASDKAEMPVFHKLASQLDLPSVGIDADRLSSQATITQSATSQAHRTTGSVAEAAALAAAGQRATLLGPRVISSDRLATCALAAGTDR